MSRIRLASGVITSSIQVAALVVVWHLKQVPHIPASWCLSPKIMGYLGVAGGSHVTPPPHWGSYEAVSGRCEASTPFATVWRLRL